MSEFNIKGSAGDQLLGVGFALAQDGENGLGFKGNAGLSLIVEGTIEATGIKVNPVSLTHTSRIE
ncbi:MAG: hypothetical protein AAGE59_20230 [Cyanobacteria bacterium P01_F01_bin.86]